MTEVVRSRIALAAHFDDYKVVLYRNQPDGWAGGDPLDPGMLCAYAVQGRGFSPARQV